MAYIGGIVAEDCAGLQASSATRVLRAFTRDIGRVPTRVHFLGPLRRHTGPQFGPVRGGVLEGTPSGTSHRGIREHRTPPPFKVVYEVPYKSSKNILIVLVIV